MCATLHLSAGDDDDEVIDLGPEGGATGGRIVFGGMPRALSDCPKSLTSRYPRQSSRAVDTQGGTAEHPPRRRRAVVLYGFGVAWYD